MKRGQALLPVPDAFPFRGAETVWRSGSIWFSQCFVVSLSIGFQKLWHEPVFIDTRQMFWFVGARLISKGHGNRSRKKVLGLPVVLVWKLMAPLTPELLV